MKVIFKETTIAPVFVITTPDCFHVNYNLNYKENYRQEVHKRIPVYPNYIHIDRYACIVVGFEYDEQLMHDLTFVT